MMEITEIVRKWMKKVYGNSEHRLICETCVHLTYIAGRLYCTKLNRVIATLKTKCKYYANIGLDSYVEA